MENSLVIRDNDKNEMALQVDEIRKFIAPTATDQEFWLFINTAKALNLNPIKREIYFVKFNNQAQIITGYQVYLERAIRSGKLEYWNVKVEKPDPADRSTWMGIFTGKRSDWTEEFIWQVPMKEVDKKQSTWNLMPEFQLKKSTLAQGIRLLVPEILSGMPYTAEEVTAGTSEQFNGSHIIEPLEDELKAKEQERLKAIQAVQDRINKCDDIVKLDKLYSQEKLNTSELKTEIEAMLADRRAILLESEWEVKVQKLAVLTGIAVPDISSYVNADIMDSEVVSEALAGLKDAIKQFGLDVKSFLQAMSESVDEESVPESLIPENVHNPE